MNLCISNFLMEVDNHKIPHIISNAFIVLLFALASAPLVIPLNSFKGILCSIGIFCLGLRLFNMMDIYYRFKVTQTIVKVGVEK